MHLRDGRRRKRHVVKSNEALIDGGPERALDGSAQRCGAELALGTRVTGGRVLHNGRILLQTRARAERLDLECDVVVNAAPRAQHRLFDRLRARAAQALIHGLAG